ncbi:MAG TPA: Rv3235 family protein [Pseudonocardia sp.]|nr:Rv3235 family protein [Pseudonocardia sp.]
MTSTIPAVRPMVRRLPDFETNAGPGPAGFPAADPARLPAPPPGSIPVPRRPEADDAPPAPALPVPPPRREVSPPPDRARVHAHVVLRQVLEVLDGRRPAGQLAGLVSESVLGYVVAVAGRLDDPGLRRPTGSRRRAGVHRVGLGERTRAVGLRSMRVCHPADGIAEISVVWRYRGRFRALAARFEQARPDDELDAIGSTQVGRGTSEPAPSGPAPAGLAGEAPWRCTALRVG